MKINSLEIHELRGIKHLSLDLSGKNAYVFGPNGSGKSGVVDAVDFLFTGSITRLSGQGTQGISIKEHGKHIDAQIGESYVQAKICLGDPSTEVTLRRNLNKFNELIYDSKHTKLVDQILEIAKLGHFVLLRKNLLSYIAAQGKERANAVLKLLNISEVETTRLSLKKYLNGKESDYKNANIKLKSFESQISNALSLQTFTIEETLKKINDARSVFGAKNIISFIEDDIFADIHMPESESGKPSINTTSLSKEVDELKKFFNVTAQEELKESLTKYQHITSEFCVNSENVKLVNLHSFIKSGISYLDDSGKCPLCKHQWDPEELKRYLNQRLADATTLSNDYQEIIRKSSQLTNKLQAAYKIMINVSNKLKYLPIDSNQWLDYQEWIERIKKAVIILENPFNPNSLLNMKEELDPCVIVPKDVLLVLDKIELALLQLQTDRTPEGQAWDLLTQLKIPLQNYSEAKVLLETHSRMFKNAQVLYNTFLESRDSVMNELFDSINERFTSLYRAIHGEDEANFTSEMKYSDAAIELNVDFYQRGKYPPLALHSEGHQDSMGICLYLALAEKLTEGLFNVIVLDDVVMSVDSNHRKQFSKLLSKEFSDIQFIITTHDEVWANQLQKDGVVKGNNTFKFYNWTIDSGPLTTLDELEKWDEIYDLISNGNIRQASATLRQSCENFFNTACENLRAYTIHLQKRDHSLGDLIDPAAAKLNKLYSQSIKANDSWGNDNIVKKIEELKIGLEKARKNAGSEYWAINPTTHYNEWASLSPNDFLPVAKSYEELFKHFKCSKCNSMLTLAMSGSEELALICTCMDVNLTLKGKKVIT